MEVKLKGNIRGGTSAHFNKGATKAPRIRLSGYANSIILKQMQCSLQRLPRLWRSIMWTQKQTLQTPMLFWWLMFWWENACSMTRFLQNQWKPVIRNHSMSICIQEKIGWFQIHTQNISCMKFHYCTCNVCSKSAFTKNILHTGRIATRSKEFLG